MPTTGDERANYTRKSTTAIHLAAYFSRRGRTVLVDGDPNRTSERWAARGQPPFTVVPGEQIAVAARKYEHVIIDTQARTELRHLKSLAEGCDLLVLPCTPDPYSMDALTDTIAVLQQMGADQFRILLTVWFPRDQCQMVTRARELILHAGLPIFRADIRRTIAFQRSALDGITVDQVKGNDTAGLAWRDYEQVGEEIEEFYGQTNAAGV